MAMWPIRLLELYSPYSVCSPQQNRHSMGINVDLLSFPGTAAPRYVPQVFLPGSAIGKISKR